MENQKGNLYILSEDVQTKNFKKYYVPKTMIIYFSDTDLDFFDNLSKLVVEYTDFIKIGDVDNAMPSGALNKIKKSFYSWKDNSGKSKTGALKPSTFFGSNYGQEILRKIKETDLVVLVYKQNSETSLEYVSDFVEYLNKFDVFAFHYVIENFVVSQQTEKERQKLLKKISRRKQVYVPIKEESVVLAYQNATIANRNYYMNQYLNNVLESFISPFLDPIKNPDHFVKIKKLFYTSPKNFESKMIASIGYSEKKEDSLEVALIQALSNPLFSAAFDASHTFLVNIKVPFIEPQKLAKVEKVLKAVTGDWKNFVISTYIGSFDFNVYTQVSIMAINVNEDKLITDPEKIDQYVKNAIKEVEKSKNITVLEDQKTRELILEKPIQLLEDK